MIDRTFRDAREVLEGLHDRRPLSYYDYAALHNAILAGFDAVRERDALRARLAEVERERDLALRARSLESEGFRIQRDGALEALRKTVQGLDAEDKPCWCSIPSMIPYRGHDIGCELARAALAAPGEEPRR